MTRDEYKTALKYLGWSQMELCRRLGLSKNTPNGWRPTVPEYVAAYVTMAVKAKQALER